MTADLERIVATEWEIHKGKTGIRSDSGSEAFRFGFLAGYARGRADAMELPEVRAEELEEGKLYVGLTKNNQRRPVYRGDITGCVYDEILEVQADILQFGFVGFYGPVPSLEQFSFRGPLRVGEGK